eukprot:TRINITY_DN1254_c0_g3_i1.p1 TRINITY_DN1254_c0_g3~~TRINITY_DN1254_c0_g3_i1.p1  ORF type:complete len:529 (+),score=62.72 TRINITY_DN1254_c0_g3_i1:24-1589(+)
MMWHLSSHNHSLHRLYRFRDPKLESRYQKSMNQWNLYNAQFHIFSVIVDHGANCASFWSTPLTIDFWVFSVGMAVSIAFFLLPFVFHRARNYMVFIHFVFAILRIAERGALIGIETPTLVAGIVSEWIPADHHLVILAPDGGMILKDAAFRGLISQFLDTISILLMYMVDNTVLFHLCLNGLNVWTLLGCTVTISWAAVAVALIRQAAPSWQTLWLGATTWLMFIALATLLERVQRLKFLAETLLERQMHAVETADTILNHTLKNILADVASYIELFLAGSASPELLKDGVSCLRRGMRACKERQAYVRLVAREYVPVRHTTNLRQFAEGLADGMPVSVHAVDITVPLDTTLCSLILENALCNAVKHGRPNDANVALDVRHSTSPDGTSHVEFVVSNAADPGRPPLTPELVAQLFGGSKTGQPVRRVTALSEGIGLEHSLLAARTGGVSLSLAQEGDIIIFRAVLEAEPVSRNPSEGTFASSTSLLWRIVEHSIRRSCPTAVITVLGGLRERRGAILGPGV